MRSGLLLALCVMAAAGGRPDFSGSWKMDGEKSNFGEMPKPQHFSLRIDHQDPRLKVSGAQTGQRGDYKYEFTYTTDGKECVNKMMGNEQRSTVKWDGSRLLFDSKMDWQGTPVVIREEWSLSRDGKVLTIRRRLTLPDGVSEASLAMNRE